MECTVDQFWEGVWAGREVLAEHRCTRRKINYWLGGGAGGGRILWAEPHSTYRVEKYRECTCPLSWRDLYVMVNRVKGGGAAPPFTRPGLVFPSWWNVHQKSALCVLSGQGPVVREIDQLWERKEPCEQSTGEWDSRGVTGSNIFIFLYVKFELKCSSILSCIKV